MVEQLRWVKAVEFPLAVPKRSEVTLPDNHAQLIYLAKVAEQSERFDEMVACMRKVVMMSSELSVEERNLLSMAYKNVIGSRRSSWRIASSIEGRERERGNNETIPLTAMYRAQFEEEVGAVCDDIIGLLDTYLVPAAQTGEAKVFYLKMKGDYHRYHAEITSGNDQKEKAHEVYKKALEVANSSLAPTHPIRLGLVLNFSVFYYEILKERTKGVELAQQAYANASSEIDALEEEDTYKEASLIMQLLRDNLTLWAEESEGNADQ